MALSAPCRHDHTPRPHPHAPCEPAGSSHSKGLATLTLLAATTACGGPGATIAKLDPHREEHVAADPNASVTDIINAGGPTAVATHDDTSARPADDGGIAGTTGSTSGTTLVAYAAESDTTEGPNQGAFRLYDRQGRSITDGALGQVFDAAAVPDLSVVPDGYLIGGYTTGLDHLRNDGTLSAVTTSRNRVATRAGDVLLPAFDVNDARVYRPSTRTAYRLPKLPFTGVDRVALEKSGRLWAQEAGGPRVVYFSSSADGTGPWTRTRIPVSASGLAQNLQVLADHVVVATSSGNEGALDALWTRPTSAPPSSAWRKVAATGVRLIDLEPTFGTLAFTGRLVIAGANQVMYVQDTSGTFTALKAPKGVPYSYLRVTPTGLYLVGSPDNKLYRSVNGTTWETVDR